MEALLLKKILLPATNLILESVPYLTELDSATGDGDHGVSMGKICKKIEECVLSLDGSESIVNTLDSLSWDLMNISGGSAGPLWGAFFEGMADGAKKAYTSEDQLVRNILISGFENFSDVSGAKVGDKTMMDAIYPATILLNEGGTFKEMAKAAEQGAEATINMTAKFGRARSLNEKAIGHKDPGAVSFSLFYKGIAEGLDE